MREEHARDIQEATVLLKGSGLNLSGAELDELAADFMRPEWDIKSLIANVYALGAAAGMRLKDSLQDELPF